MPIKPENQALYPGGSIRSAEWLAIRERIRARAGNCCEWCGLANHLIGIRSGDGFHVVMPGELGGRASVEVDGIIVSGKVIQIVCTVAHLDQKLTDHSDENLRFLCQKCHNRHDAADRRINASLTLRDKKAGTKDMFGRSQ